MAHTACTTKLGPSNLFSHVIGEVGSSPTAKTWQTCGPTSISRSTNTLGSANDGTRGRDPSRRWVMRLPSSFQPD